MDVRISPDLHKIGVTFRSDWYSWPGSVDSSVVRRGPKDNAAPIEEEELRRSDDLMRENEALRDLPARLSEASLRID